MKTKRFTNEMLPVYMRNNERYSLKDMAMYILRNEDWSCINVVQITGQCNSIGESFLVIYH